MGDTLFLRTLKLKTNIRYNGSMLELGVVVDGVLLNNCPWCGADILFWKKDEKKP